MATFYLVISPEECALMEVGDRLKKATIIRLVGEADCVNTIDDDDLDRLVPEVQDTLCGGGFVDEFLDEDTILLATTGRE